MLVNGYVKLYRKILDHPIFTQLPASVLKVWMVCLIRANIEATKWYDGHQQIDIPAGAFIFSQDTLAKDCHLSRHQIRTALQHLQNLHCVAIKSTNKYSLLVIEKWTIYQLTGPARGQQYGQQAAIGGPTSGQQAATEEEVKKLRREENTPPRAIAPPLKLAKPLDAWAEDLYSRHPKKRDKGLVGLALLSVLEKAPDPETLIMEIDRRHAGWCKTTEWTEKNGRFAPTLAQWLTDHGWTQRPDTELPPPRRWVEED